MSEAIVVVPKPGKDPELCNTYEPISILNVDAKILIKILTNRLNSVILSLVHRDQTGFILGKGTDINICRLCTNITFFSEGDAPGVVASLDSEKAFDSGEWEFLWQILQRFRFGPQFVSLCPTVVCGPFCLG